MEIKLDLGINQILGLIKQLPSEQKIMLKQEIDKEFNKKNKPASNKVDLRKILLSGLVMSEEEVVNFENLNRSFNSWTNKNIATTIPGLL